MRSEPCKSARSKAKLWQRVTSVTFRRKRKVRWRHLPNLFLCHYQHRNHHLRSKSPCHTTSCVHCTQPFGPWLSTTARKQRPLGVERKRALLSGSVQNCVGNNMSTWVHRSHHPRNSLRFVCSITMSLSMTNTFLD